MTHDDLKKLIMDDFKNHKPVDKESAMSFVRVRLENYPKQLQEFGDWFDNNSESVLKRINR